jgi:hypothetical protein
MEENQSTNENSCSFCKKEMTPPDAVFCNHCGHPENGTDQQRAQFFAKRAVNKTKHIDADKKIKSARNTLFILSGILGVFGFFLYFSTNDIVTLGANLLISFIYLALGFWSKEKPMIALLVGLLLYVTLVVISAIVDPTSLYRGILWKILIITFLGKGLYSANAVKNQ